MHGIISLLDNIYTTQVEAVWQELESACGLTGIQVTPLPHFSWHVAKDYQLERLRPVLEEIARNTPRFHVRTSGLAIFSGLEPVLYIPVVREAGLSRLHERIWREVIPLSAGSNPYYAPENWMPHITLAHGDLDVEKLKCAIDRLVLQPFNWEIQVNGLALVTQEEAQIGSLQYVVGLSLSS